MDGNLNVDGGGGKLINDTPLNDLIKGGPRCYLTTSMSSLLLIMICSAVWSHDFGHWNIFLLRINANRAYTEPGGFPLIANDVKVIDVMRTSIR